MVFRVVVVLSILCAVDAYFFRGHYLAATVAFVQNFGENVNDGVSQFTRRLQ